MSQQLHFPADDEKIILAYPACAYSSNPVVHITRNGLIGCTAKWTYIQHPYHNPPNFGSFIRKIFEEFPLDPDAECVGDDFYILEKHYADIIPWLRIWYNKHQEFLDWNMSVNELTGKKLRQTEGFVATSAYDTIPLEDDFIDLDALVRNITWELYLHMVCNEY